MVVNGATNYMNGDPKLRPPHVKKRFNNNKTMKCDKFKMNIETNKKTMDGDFD